MAPFLPQRPALCRVWYHLIERTAAIDLLPLFPPLPPLTLSPPFRPLLAPSSWFRVSRLNSMRPNNKAHPQGRSR